MFEGAEVGVLLDDDGLVEDNEGLMEVEGGLVEDDERKSLRLMKPRSLQTG